MKECHRCGFNDEDYGCTCPHSDKWYACPIESEKPNNKKALEEYAEWVSKYQNEFVLKAEIEPQEGENKDGSN